MARRYRGGDIASSAFIPEAISDDLKNIHIDRKVIPVIDGRNSKNISIQNKYYELINTNGLGTGTLGPAAGLTVNFQVTSDPQTMISLPDSFFCVKLSILAQQTMPAPPGPRADPLNQNFAILPWASKLFFNRVDTNINNVNCSDIQGTSGLYPYTSFVKNLLLMPRQDPTYLLLPEKVNYGDATTTYQNFPRSQSSDTAGAEYISLGLSNQTVDNANVVPADTTAVTNNNACYYKNLGWVTPTDQYGYDPLKIATMLATGNGYDAANAEIIIRVDDGVWTSQSGYLPTSTQIDLQCQINGYLKWMGVDAAMPVDDYPLVSITGLTLHLCRVRPTEDSLFAINQALNMAPFVYNILNSKNTTVDIAASGGSTTLNFPGVFSGIVPNVLALMFVNTKVYNQVGTFIDCHPFSCGRMRKLDTNPVNISKLYVMAGSQKYPINNEYLCNETTVSQQYVLDTYNHYRQCCVDSDKPFLTFDHWQNQFTVFYVNLCNDHPLVSATDETRTGSVSVNITTVGATPAMQMICVGLFYSQVAINRNRTVQRINFD